MGNRLCEPVAIKPPPYALKEIQELDLGKYRLKSPASIKLIFISLQAVS
jgi:hypothetical protein